MADDLARRDGAQTPADRRGQVAGEAEQEAGGVEIAGPVVSTTRATGSAATSTIVSPDTMTAPFSLRVSAATLPSRLTAASASSKRSVP